LIKCRRCRGNILMMKRSQHPEKCTLKKYTR
jgi:hypothetical protein